jgi:hypothetical protein
MLDSMSQVETKIEAPIKKKRYVSRAVYAPMMALGENKKTKVQVGTKTVPAEGIFGGIKKGKFIEEPVYEEKSVWVPNGKFSRYQIDQIALTRLTEEAMNKLDDEGYEVISVTPYVEGDSDTSYLNGGSGINSNYAGFGWSHTRGVIISAKLRD